MKKEKETRKIVITKETHFVLPKSNGGDMLIIGNFNGLCGDIVWNGPNTGEMRSEVADYQSTIEKNFESIINVMKSGSNVIIAAERETTEYFKRVIYYCMDMVFWDKTPKEKRKILENFYTIDTTEIYEREYKRELARNKKNGKESVESEKIREFVNNYIFENIKDMQFDIIIQNPPYNGSLHLDFFEKGLEHLNKDGKMIIIEPATWLINVRKNGKAKKYDAIKKQIEGHIESVVIENLNKAFNTGLYVPFATTTIDMSKTFDTIVCNICGEHKLVKSIYDCNLVGKYETIWGILDKVQKFGDMMKNHITKEDKGEGMWYAKYAEIVGGVGGALCAATTERLGGKYDEETAIFKKSLLGEYCTSYTSVAYHFFGNNIESTPLCAYDRGKHLTDKVTDNIYGTKTELENWKHFIFNNKLPLFINIVMTIDQNNCSKEFLPWLVDKQYTDDEINKMFGFTDEEIKLIDTTIKKYERNSPWFKRYMCGKDSVSDEDVNKYIEEISK